MASEFGGTGRPLTFDRQNIIDSSAPRFSPIFANDHAGYIWIVGIVALIYSLMATITRCFVKMRMFGTDDYLLTSAAVSFGFILWILQILRLRITPYCSQVKKANMLDLLGRSFTSPRQSQCSRALTTGLENSTPSQILNNGRLLER